MKELIIPSTQCSVDHIWNNAPSFGPPKKTQETHPWSGPASAAETSKMLRGCSICPVRRSWGTWACSAQGQLRGDLTATCLHLQGRQQGARLTAVGLGEQAEVGTREVQTGYEKTCLHHEDSQEVEEVLQRSSAVSMFQGFQGQIT